MSSKAEKQRHLEETAKLRAELTETLEAVQDRLNVSRRIDEKVAAFQRLRVTKPAVYYSAIVGAVATAGAIGWGVYRYIMRCK